MKILFVVSGGDAPGIHSVLYHTAILADRHGVTLVGARGGFVGVLSEQFVPIVAQDLMPWLTIGGSYLPSSRNPVLASEVGRDRLKDVLARHAIDALILFGGDGTLRHIPPLLAQWGIACMGLPTTIDNDVPGTDLTLGFDSAANFAYSAIDGMRATGHALTGRIFTLETLGGDTGFLALEVAQGASADVVLLPEFAYDHDAVMQRLQEAIQARGQALLVYSEGLKDKEQLHALIPEKTGIRVRGSRLGHAQRGGSPSHRDRALAVNMSEIAFDALQRGVQNGVVVVTDGKTRLHDGVLAITAPKRPDFDLYQRINRFDKS
jgi:6-phosphofructokinase 1